MARTEPEQPADDEAQDLVAGRRKAVRYGVPLAVAGLAAATIGLVPALAQDDGSPDLEKVSAEELIAKVLGSKVQTVEGTVKVSADVGLPALPSGSGGGSPFGGGGGSGEDSEDGGDGSSADPQGKALELLSGENTLRVAADGEDRQRVSLIGEDGDYTAIHNGKDLWAYDSAANEVFHSTTPEKDADAGKGSGKDGEHQVPEDLKDLTPQQLAERALEAAGDTTDVTVDGTAKVAGQDAYQLKVAPKQEESTVKDIRIAVDADNGAPLKVTLTADDGTRAIDVGFTDVDFGTPDEELFDFTPPEGAKVTEADELKKPEDSRGKGEQQEWLKDTEVHGEGWTSVAEFDLPDGALGGSGSNGDGQQLLDMFTKETDEGRLFSSRLVNALITDDGKVYVGAVTEDALAEAAGE